MNEAANIRVYYHPGQKAIFFDSSAKVKIIVKGRRFGLTKGFANFVIERMIDGVSPVLWVDTVNTNIDRYVERYFYPVLNSLPPKYWQWRQQKKELTVFNSKCDLRSADRPELIEGFAYRLIILNEAGIILNDEYLWENTIRPMTLDFNPDQLIGGTPKGKNLFFDLAQKAQDRQDPRYKDWEHFHRTSYDNPFIAREEIDALAADMPEHVRRQEIFGEFLDDATGVFRNVDTCIGSEKEAPQQDHSYYMGVDLAKHVDFTVISIIDDLGNQVYWMRLNKMDWPYQKRLIADTARTYDALVCIDSTGLGDPIYDDLKNDGLRIIGYPFTKQSKKQLIECLMLSIEQAKIKILNEPIQINELKNFGYEITGSRIKYSAPEGKHDDCVIGLGLSNWARENSMAYRPGIIVI